MGSNGENDIRIICRDQPVNKFNLSDFWSKTVTSCVFHDKNNQNGIFALFVAIL